MYVLGGGTPEGKAFEPRSRENFPFLYSNRAAALVSSQRDLSRSSPPPLPVPPLRPPNRSRSERRPRSDSRPCRDLGTSVDTHTCSSNLGTQAHAARSPRSSASGVRVLSRRLDLGSSPSCSRRHVGGGHRPGLPELLCCCGPRRRHRNYRQ